MKTNKNIKKLAKEIYDCEMIIQNTNSTPEEVSNAEKRITLIMNSCASNLNSILELEYELQNMLTK